MDGINKQIISMSTQLQSAQLAQAVQISVLKRALDMQGNAVQTLLQPVTGSLPLTTSGSVGTRLNVLA